MEIKNALFNYTLQLADNAMILGQRLSEWCGHAPELETDIGMTNLALDLIGQASQLYQYAAKLEGKGRTEDDMAFLRDHREYRNALLVEQPNEDFAYTIARNFFFDLYNYFLNKELQNSKDETIAAIAEKAIKEIAYHVRFSSEWVIRLGDGTEESHRRMQEAIDHMWTYTGELFIPNEVEKTVQEYGIGVDLDKIKAQFDAQVNEIFKEATLTRPADGWMQKGGKDGLHSEHLGFILAEMQWMQRAYPAMEW